MLIMLFVYTGDRMSDRHSLMSSAFNILQEKSWSLSSTKEFVDFHHNVFCTNVQ